MAEETLETKYRIDETPAKTCGGRVREIGGRDQVLVRGAGVERVLHTVRMEFITQAGASGMTEAPEMPLGRKLAKVRGVREVDGLSGRVVDLFKGVDLVGVFWRPRGVAAAALDGVRVGLDSLVGVDGVEPVREGVPGTEPLAERFVPAVLDDRERSRKE